MDNRQSEAARYARLQQEAVKRLEQRGIHDPRATGGACEYDAVRKYDMCLSNEIQKLLRYKDYGSGLG